MRGFSFLGGCGGRWRWFLLGGGGACAGHEGIEGGGWFGHGAAREGEKGKREKLDGGDSMMR